MLKTFEVWNVVIQLRNRSSDITKNAENVLLAETLLMAILYSQNSSVNIVFAKVIFHCFFVLFLALQFAIISKL